MKILAKIWIWTGVNSTGKACKISGFRPRFFRGLSQASTFESNQDYSPGKPTYPLKIDGWKMIISFWNGSGDMLIFGAGGGGTTWLKWGNLPVFPLSSLRLPFMTHQRWQWETSRSETQDFCQWPTHKGWLFMCIYVYIDILGGGFKDFFSFTPTWGNDPIWLIFIRWVETTN